MCGRYTLRRINLVRADFNAMPLPGFEEFTERGRFNVAPSQSISVIRINSGGQRVLGTAKWGLIPSWAGPNPKAKPINARAETVATSGMFKKAFDRRRCLIPADGFYEWQGAKPPKQPFFFHRPDESLFAFAGIWERWSDGEDSKPLDTVAIITTTANDTVAPVHARMPVMLSRDNEFNRWLDRNVPGEEVRDLLKPFDEPLQADAVSTRVNTVTNDAADLIEPAGTD